MFDGLLCKDTNVLHVQKHLDQFDNTCACKLEQYKGNVSRGHIKKKVLSLTETCCSKPSCGV